MPPNAGPDVRTPDLRTSEFMPTRRISGARNVVGDVLVLVGTTKGAFVFTSDASRKRWRVDGPHFPGEAVYSLAFDQRAGRTRLLAGVIAGLISMTLDSTIIP